MIDNIDKEDRPPILGSWNKLYIFVLGNLAFLIILFYFFTRYYS